MTEKLLFSLIVDGVILIFSGSFGLERRKTKFNKAELLSTLRNLERKKFAVIE